MLIFLIIFFEMAILYFAGPILLGARQPAPKTAWAGFGLMVAGALIVDFVVFWGRADVLFTSYVPLQAHPLYYLGIILFAVGALIATLHLLRHDVRREAREDLRGLGAAGHLRRADRRDHRGDHAAARRGHLHPDLPLVARPDRRSTRRSTASSSGASATRRSRSTSRRWSRSGTCWARSPSAPWWSTRRSVAGRSCSTSCSSRWPRRTICWSTPAWARPGRSGTPATRCTSRCSPR